MSTIGRPRVLDDKKRRDIVTLVGVGFGLQDAARYVGCSISTVRREMGRDEEFAQEVRSSEVRGQIDAIRGLRAAASTHWRAAAWYLERTNPRRFARPSPRAFNPDEIQTVFDDVIAAAVDEIDDRAVRDRVCRRLTLAGGYAARALESDPTRRVEPRSAIPVHKSEQERQIDALMQEVEEDNQRAWRSIFRGGGPNGKPMSPPAPSANGAKAKPAA